MMKIRIIYFIIVISIIKAARILGVFPTPSISHQIVFRPLMEGLANRGHEVVVITADPAYLKEKGPLNLSEIDVHDIEYAVISNFTKIFKEDSHFKIQSKQIFDLLAEMFEVLVQSEQVQNLIHNKNRRFDLIFIETCIRSTISFSYLYQVPVIEFSSFSGYYGTFESIGAATHPILYPNAMSRKISFDSIWQKINEIYHHYSILNIFNDHVEYENNMLRKIFGSHIPDINELRKNIHMSFLNVHPIWDFNRPIPPNVIYLGQMHLQKERQKELPEEITLFMNSSTNGVIYMSFGTNVKSSFLPPEKIKIFTKIFSEIPYEVLWKWDGEAPNDLSKNVKISKWFPQSVLLKHPKMKLFITQAGLQSTDEAITARVPLIAVPFLGDQWYNAEQYVIHGIGKIIHLEDLNENLFKQSIEDVIGNKSYQENIIKLSKIISDQPQTQLEKAIWWTEYVLRHNGSKHLMAPAAHLSWVEYYEVNLLVSVFGVILIGFVFMVLVLRRLLSVYCSKEKKLKET